MSDLENQKRIEEIVETWPDEPDMIEHVHAYRIPDKSAAAWAMENLRTYIAAIEENLRVAQDRMDAIKATIQERLDELALWRDTENEKLQRSVDFFDGLLATWHMTQVTADPDDEKAWSKDKAKTISLPDGKLSVRKTSSIEITDEDAAVAWALENDRDLVSMSISKQAIKTAEVIYKDDIITTSNGEPIPGVRRTEDLSWKVTPNK